MGLVHADLKLSNPRLPELKPMQVNALVDSGAFMLCIPQGVASQLKLESLEDRIVTIADGSQTKAPFVGPIEIAFDNRRTFVGAMVLGDEVLMGAIPMEDMDLVISPKEQKLMVNPAHPNFPVTVAKGFRVSAAAGDKKAGE